MFTAIGTIVTWVFLCAAAGCIIGLLGVVAACFAGFYVLADRLALAMAILDGLACITGVFTLLDIVARAMR